MALLDFRDSFAGGRNRVWWATVGASDLPTTGGIGDWTVGDIVWNLAPGAGGPSRWVCNTVSAAGAPTFLTDVVAGGTIKTLVPPATISPTDFFDNSPAGALTLPPVAGFIVGKVVTIHATASSVTITPTSPSTVNGAAALTLTANANAQLLTDGTNWFTSN